jgi:hypothetical protein
MGISPSSSGPIGAVPLLAILDARRGDAVVLSPYVSHDAVAPVFSPAFAMGYGRAGVVCPLPKFRLLTASDVHWRG